MIKGEIKLVSMIQSKPNRVGTFVVRLVSISFLVKHLGPTSARSSCDHYRSTDDTMARVCV